MNQPTSLECAVDEFLKDMRQDEDVNEKKFQQWSGAHFSNDLQVIRVMMVMSVKQYNSKLEDLKKEISETEVVF